MNIGLDEKYEISTYKIENPVEFESDVYQKIYSLLDEEGTKRYEYILGVVDGGSYGELCMHLDGVFWVACGSERGLRLNPCFLLAL